MGIMATGTRTTATAATRIRGTATLAGWVGRHPDHCLENLPDLPTLVFHLGLPDLVGSRVNRLVRLRFAGSPAGLGWAAGLLEIFMARHPEDSAVGRPVDLVVGTRLDSGEGTPADLAAATLASTPANERNERCAAGGAKGVEPICFKIPLGPARIGTILGADAEHSISPGGPVRGTAAPASRRARSRQPRPRDQGDRAQRVLGTGATLLRLSLARGPGGLSLSQPASVVATSAQNQRLAITAATER